jgi:hypothetical protein
MTRVRDAILLAAVIVTGALSRRPVRALGDEADRPGLFAAALMELSLIEAGVVCGLECAVMIPVMFIVMWHRREDYTDPHHKGVEREV